MGDVASEILDVVSVRRCYAKFHGRRQNESDEWLKNNESNPVEDHHATRSGPPALLKDDWNIVRGGSSSGPSRRQGTKGHVSNFGNFLSTTAAQSSRLAQGILDIIVIPPMEISLTLSKGFHNAPLLFQDDTVRNIPRVTGVRSGLETAGTVRVSSDLELYTLCRTSSFYLLTRRAGVHIRHLQGRRRPDRAASPRS